MTTTESTMLKVNRTSRTSGGSGRMIIARMAIRNSGITDW
jgi:hypothetical protein